MSPGTAHACAYTQKKRAEEQLEGEGGQSSGRNGGGGTKEQASKEEMAQALRDNILAQVNSIS